MSKERKMINGELCVYCKDIEEWVPKFVTEGGILKVFDENYCVYLPKAYKTDEPTKVQLFYEALSEYNLSPCYGIARERYLKEEKYDLYLELKDNLELREHLVIIDIRANEMEDRLVKQLAQAEGVTEELKKKNQMEWVGRMKNIIYRVREIVQNELIFV